MAMADELLHKLAVEEAMRGAGFSEEEIAAGQSGEGVLNYQQRKEREEADALRTAKFQEKKEFQLARRAAEAKKKPRPPKTATKSNTENIMPHLRMDGPPRRPKKTKPAAKEAAAKKTKYTLSNQRVGGQSGVHKTSGKTPAKKKSKAELGKSIEAHEKKVSASKRKSILERVKGLAKSVKGFAKGEEQWKGSAKYQARKRREDKMTPAQRRLHKHRQQIAAGKKARAKKKVETEKVAGKPKKSTATKSPAYPAFGKSRKIEGIGKSESNPEKLVGPELKLGRHAPSFRPKIGNVPLLKKDLFSADSWGPLDWPTENQIKIRHGVTQPRDMSGEAARRYRKRPRGIPGEAERQYRKRNPKKP